MAQLFGSGIRNNLNKEKTPSGGGAWRLLTFMIFVFSVFILSYFGLSLGYKNFVMAEIEDKDLELEELAKQVSKPEQDEFLKFQFQLINLKNILNNHVLASKIFPLIENNTNAQVYYKSMSLDTTENKINISGFARSYEALAEQLNAYQRMPEIQSYKIGSAKAGEGGQIQFDVLLNTSSKVWK